jgi:integrative and conjugative element protein (TIGR02256 family)
MKLLLPQRVIKRLRRKLRGRINEIGGVMVGEHVAADTFRIVDISFQKRGGTTAHFLRDPVHHKAFLSEFFTKTGHDYKRFNYIGEWHSHPAFDPLPSGEDFVTMYDIVEDPAVGVNFVVLIIARLRGWSGLELSATLFRSGLVPEPVEVSMDDAPDIVIKQTMVERILDFLT